MKKVLIQLALITCSLLACDQTIPDSIQQKYESAITFKDKGKGLYNYYNRLQNAFYSETEKKKRNDEVGQGYEPTVSVFTKKIDDKVEITAKDNGVSIPQKVLDKIFQPFFTTRPTGQGTGLGLSLSYDIINAHGGDIKVETKENEWTQFFIKLPLSGV